MKVFITGKVPNISKELLIENGFKVIQYKGDNPLEPGAFLKSAKNADALITLLRDKIDKKVIDQLKNCKIIANYAVGFNNIDVEYAGEKGIVVTNTPDILTNATADIAISLMLMCARSLCEAGKFMRDGKFNGWQPQLFLGTELSGKTFGLIGAGRIGTATAKRAKAFGMKIIYYNKSKKNDFEKSTAAKKVSLNKLLKLSDVVSVHLPLNGKTYHLLNKDNMNLMKDSVIFINTARGEIVDEKYLIRLLKSKKLKCAGLDVFEGEPAINKQLIKLKNVALLPHIGSATVETRNKMAELAAKNVINVLSGKNPITPVK